MPPRPPAQIDDDEPALAFAAPHMLEASVSEEKPAPSLGRPGSGCWRRE